MAEPQPGPSGNRASKKRQAVLSPVSPVDMGLSTEQLLQEVGLQLSGPTQWNGPVCPNLEAPQVLLGGIFHVILRYCHHKGHVELDRAGIQEIKDVDQALAGETDAISVVLLALQTLASTPDAADIFMGWAKKEEKEEEVRMDNGIVLGPRLVPWKRRDLWSFGLWSIATEVVTRFLDRGVNRTEQEFNQGLEDLRAIIKEDSWVIAIISFTLYRVRANTWFWPTLFRCDLTAFPG